MKVTKNEDTGGWTAVEWYSAGDGETIAGVCALHFDTDGHYLAEETEHLGPTPDPEELDNLVAEALARVQTEMTMRRFAEDDEAACKAGLA